MSKRTFILAAVILVALTLALSAQEDNRYLDMKNGFSIAFPDGWTLMENPPPGVLIAARSPLAGPTDTFTENINVVIEDLPRNATTAEYGAAARENFAKAVQGFKVLDKGTLEIDGRQAEYFTYTMPYGEYPLHNIVYYLVVERKTYLITCGGVEGSFDAFKDTFEKAAEVSKSRPAPRGAKHCAIKPRTRMPART